MLFQRLITAGIRNDQLEDSFPVELCSYPSAIFEARHAMMPANKPALADALIPRHTLLGQMDKASMYWMAGPWCTEYGGSVVHPTMTYVGSTQTTSPEHMDMTLQCSTGTRKDYPRNMVLMNAVHMEEQAQQWI